MNTKSIVEKQTALLQAMKQQNYQHFFEGDKDDALDTISDAMNSFVEYQNSVINMAIMQPLLYARYEGEELRDRVMNLDQTRRFKHESAIASSNMLNRICNAYGVEPFVNIPDGPVEDQRAAVAEFTGTFCQEMYDSKRTRSPKESYEIFQEHVNQHKPYESGQIRSRLDAIDSKYAEESSVPTEDNEISY